MNCKNKNSYTINLCHFKKVIYDYSPYSCLPTITQKRHKENSFENPFSRNFSLPETISPLSIGILNGTKLSVFQISSTGKGGHWTKDSRRPAIIIRQGSSVDGERRRGGGWTPSRPPDNWRGGPIFEAKAWRELVSRERGWLNGRAMFERGLKRHSYQLWEVKFQCPAKESAARRQSSAFRANWPAIYYPAGVHLTPSPPLPPSIP